LVPVWNSGKLAHTGGIRSIQGVGLGDVEQGALELDLSVTSSAERKSELLERAF
jgi:hypothetical protein